MPNTVPSWKMLPMGPWREGSMLIADAGWSQSSSWCVRVCVRVFAFAAGGLEEIR